MELKEVKEKSKKMLANFIDEIGLDGDSYTSTCNCPMAWGEPKLCGCGEFIAPESERLQEILQSAKYDEKTKRVLNQRGLILINRDYRKQEADINLFVTAIHETIHSNRNLLLFDATRESRNENAYIFNCIELIVLEDVSSMSHAETCTRASFLLTNLHACDNV